MEKPTKPQFNSGLENPSELTLLMRGMEMHMKTMGDKISTDQLVLAEKPVDFTGIFTVKASDHLDRDSTYFQFGNSFLKDYENIYNSNTLEEQNQSFQKTINACVECHQSYCPGPVMRIRKLDL